MTCIENKELTSEKTVHKLVNLLFYFSSFWFTFDNVKSRLQFACLTQGLMLSGILNNAEFLFMKSKLFA